MAIKKIALIDGLIDRDHLVPVEKVSGNDAVAARFRKIADQLREEQGKLHKGSKKLSPKVDDFLYASCIMMHAAEASLINQETGEPLLNKEGKPVAGNFSIVKDARGNNSVKWESADGILPYRNGNGDIFPEEDLLKAYKDWIGKPLCKDHISSSVDGIRGIVVDTHYDPKFKRVYALFALDRKNYAELARKVEAGYATSVSMGTAVGRSICTECSNVATVEAEYCHHVKTKTCHGEVNRDLSPIELSIVVTGADPKAKIMTVLAALEGYQKSVDAVLAGNASPSVLKNVLGELNSIPEDVIASDSLNEKSEDQAVDDILTMFALFKDTSVSDENRELGKKFLDKTLMQAGKSIETLSSENRRQVLEAAQSAGIEVEGKNDFLEQELRSALNEDSNNSAEYFDADNADGTYLADRVVDERSNARTISSLYINRARNGNNTLDITNLAGKVANLKRQIADIENQIIHEERIMSFADLKNKRLERKAYWQGTEEPTPGKPQYSSMGDQDKLREKEDRHMLQDGKMGGTSGMAPGDEQAKKLIQRAELQRRLARRAAWLKEAVAGEMSTGEAVVKNPKTNKVEIVDMQAKDGKAAAKKSKSKKDEDEDEDEDEDKKSKKGKNPFAKKDEDEDDAKGKKSKKGKNPFAKKDEDEDCDDEEDEDCDDEDEKPAAKKHKKKAYWQGTEEPGKGYALMGDQDKLREKEDRHMLQDGKMGGTSGMAPGDEQTKRNLQRMAGKIQAKLYKGATVDRSRWEFSSNGRKLLSITASQAYGDYLNKRHESGKTYANLFHTKEYGTRVMNMLREDGLKATAGQLGVSLSKFAAEPAAAGPPAPEAPPPPPPPPPAGGMDPGMDPGMSPPPPEGDQLSNEKSADEKLADLSPLVTKMEELLAEIQEVVGSKASPEEEGLAEVDVDASAPAVPPPAPGAEVTASRRVTDRDMLQAYAFISDACNELCYIESQASQRRGSGAFKKMAAQAVRDARVALADGRGLVAKYALQNKELFLAKRAQKRQALVRMAMESADTEGLDEMCATDHEMMALDEEEEAQVQGYIEDHEDEHHGEEDPFADRAEEDFLMHREEEGEPALDLSGDLSGDLAYDSMSATARKAWRKGFAKSAGEYLDIYEKERKGGGHKLEGLGMKVSDDGDKVETLTEIHNKMLEVATKPMAKVKSAAEKLDKWIKSGGINADKLDSLVAAGAVDSDVAKYWKQYLSQTEGGNEFASGLVQEFKGKKTASVDSENLEVRIRRAYSLGMNAQKKGVIGQTSADLERYVDTLKKLPEEHFNALKAHVEMYRAPQGLVSSPLVGLTDKEAGLENGGFERTASVNANPTFDNLSQIFSR